MMFPYEEWALEGIETLIDVGAASGVFLKEALSVYPLKRWLAIEMLKEHRRELLEVVSPFAAGEIRIAAVVDRPVGNAVYRKCSNLDSSSLLELNPESYLHFGYEQAKMSTADSGMAETHTLDELAMGFEQVDLLKLDVQGAESRVLHGGGMTLARTRYVVTEVLVWQHYVDQSAPGEIDRTLSDYGFREAWRGNEIRSQIDGQVLQYDTLWQKL